MNIDYHSARSQKARVSVWASKPKLVFLYVVTGVMVFLGLYLLLLGSCLGWVLLGVGVIPLVFTQWYQGELRHLAIDGDSKSIDGIISAEVLGRLSKNSSPKELAQVISELNAGKFFYLRFGLDPKLLIELASDDPNKMRDIWMQAIEIRDRTSSKNISAAVIVVALIRSDPNFQILLDKLRLDVDDLYYGIHWHNHIRGLIEGYRRPVRNGGIARDWSFGWTPLLKKFSQNISLQIDTVSMLALESHDEAVNSLIDIFSKNGRQNAMLVGRSGAGKTRVVHSFAARLIDGYSSVPSNLKYRQVLMLDAASLLAVSSEKGDLERLVPEILYEAFSAKNIIICLDDAHLFFEDGVGSVNIANILLPIINAGKLKIILAVDEQKFLRISKNNPELANAFNKIIVASATKSETIAVMQDRSIILEAQNQVSYSLQSLIESYDMGQRYVYDIAMPGRALKVMEAAARYSESGVVTVKSVHQAIEKTLNIKVGLADDSTERQKLLNLEGLIHERMVNQERAVVAVSDAIRRARAGVRNQNRPIGTFLFLGPTGVGKTELAKSLAHVYFGGENHMIRLDMNSFVNSSDVDRLLADGADYTDSLTAKVMKQPFSVILLDEIEKAHDNVLATLLQMLDEGVLRDAKNREISFRDTIIIATSNAGANRIRELIDSGLDVEKLENQFVDELIKDKHFSPEFINRFDEVVMFKPLDKKELIQIVNLMLGSVNKTLSSQKVSVVVDEQAKQYLVDKGYDPKLGARPMRRLIQRAVENIVAKKMLSETSLSGSKIDISLDQVIEALGGEINN